MSTTSEKSGQPTRYAECFARHYPAANGDEAYSSCARCGTTWSEEEGDTRPCMRSRGFWSNYGFPHGAHRVDDPPEPGYEWVWEHDGRPVSARVNWLRVAIYGGSIALVLGTLGACAMTFWH